MLLYLLKRLLYVAPIAFGVTVVCFSLVHLAPGDPLNAVAGADAPTDVVEMLRSAYGFDRPLIEQYWIWISRVLQGDLGLSIATNRSVADELARALRNTLILALAAALIGFVIGSVLGAIAGYLNGSLADKAITAFAVAGVSVPHYWLGIVLVIIFSVELGWLPSFGAGPGSSDLWHPDLDHLRYLVLPAFTLSVIPMGVVMRTVRALIAETLNQDFVQALRAKGLREFTVFLHVLRNAAPTALAVIGLQFGYLLGGSILVETVFSWPGTGFLLNMAIFQRDLPLLQGTILVLAMFFVVLNLLVDVIQTAIDPRIKRT